MSVKRKEPTQEALDKVEEIRAEAVRLGWSDQALHDLACSLEEEETLGKVTPGSIEILGSLPGHRVFWPNHERTKRLVQETIRRAVELN